MISRDRGIAGTRRNKGLRKDGVLRAVEDEFASETQGCRCIRQVSRHLLGLNAGQNDRLRHGFACRGMRLRSVRFDDVGSPRLLRQEDARRSERNADFGPAELVLLNLDVNGDLLTQLSIEAALIENADT